MNHETMSPESDINVERIRNGARETLLNLSKFREMKVRVEISFTPFSAQAGSLTLTPIRFTRETGQAGFDNRRCQPFVLLTAPQVNAAFAGGTSAFYAGEIDGFDGFDLTNTLGDDLLAVRITLRVIPSPFTAMAPRPS